MATTDTAAPRLRHPARAAAVLVLISVLWGSSFTLLRIVSRDFTALEMSLGRTLVAAAFLLLILAARRQMRPLSKTAWRHVLTLAVIGQVMPLLLLSQASHYTASINTAIMTGSVPFITLFAARFMPDGESWTWAKWGGLALGLAGVIIAAGNASGAGVTDASLDMLGKGLALLASVGYALGALLSRNAREHVGVLELTAWSLAASAALLALVWLASLGLGYGHAHLPPLRPVLLIAVLGVFNSALAYLLYYWLIRAATATFAGLNNYLVPVLGMFIGAQVLGEPIGLSAIAGLSLILVSIYAMRHA